MARIRYNAWVLRQIYRRLDGHYGPQHWWPAETRLEMIVGAILTQNTAWTNVEQALGAMKRNGLLMLDALRDVPEPRLAELIRPSGYFNQKARKVKAFIAFLDAHYGGSLRRMTRADGAALRMQLLQIHGIGPETADCILLYAADKPSFVVDAYTRRVLARHGICAPDLSYEALQQRIEGAIERDLHLYQQYHALLVQVGKDYCRKQPLCRGCPLEAMLGNRE